MQQMIIDEIRRYVKVNPGNRFPAEEDQPYFEEPLIGLLKAMIHYLLNIKQSSAAST
jgi:hypothetical protein